MTSQPPGISSSTCILNGHSAHVEEAKAHIARISGEVGVEVQVVVTMPGDDVSSLAARAVSERAFSPTNGLSFICRAACKHRQPWQPFPRCL